MLNGLWPVRYEAKKSAPFIRFIRSINYFSSVKNSYINPFSSLRLDDGVESVSVSAIRIAERSVTLEGLSFTWIRLLPYGYG